MIAVLKSMTEIGNATQKLQLLGAGYHSDPFKNWDVSMIADLVSSLDRSEPILDVGCGESRCSVLNMLHKMGFSNLHGVDLRISLPDRIEQFLAMRNKGVYRPPFKLHQTDGASTPFKDGTFAAVVSVSTIEHGVDLPRFFSEAARILKPGGSLLVTTDYWPEPPDVGGRTAWGLPWRIFSAADIQSILRAADAAGLASDSVEIPAAEDKPVNWGGASYTFLAMTFQKRRG